MGVSENRVYPKISWRIIIFPNDLGLQNRLIFLIKNWPCSPGVAWAQRRPQKAWLVCWCRISRGHGDHVLTGWRMAQDRRMLKGNLGFHHGFFRGSLSGSSTPPFQRYLFFVVKDLVSWEGIPDRCIVLNQPVQPRRATVNHRQSCWNRHFVVKHTLDWASKNWKSAIMCKCVYVYIYI